MSVDLENPDSLVAEMERKLREGRLNRADFSGVRDRVLEFLMLYEWDRATSEINDEKAYRKCGEILSEIYKLERKKYAVQKKP